MREALLDRLRCPKCQAERSFRLEAAERDEREIREGDLHCEACGLLARRFRPARRAYLHGRNLVRRDVAFNMTGHEADG